MPRAFIGCSGFLYDDWRGVFYPEGTPKSKWLKHYCGVFSTVELNVTFYGLPKVETFRKWRRETPDGFVASLKGSRFITHVKRLKEPAGPLRNFFERATALKEKLGVILWQLPPNFRFDYKRLKEFIMELKKYGVKNTFEFRDETWLNEDVAALFKEEKISLCMADWPPYLDDLPVTVDYVYIRRHGRGGSYATSYSEDELRRDAKRIKKYLKDGKDVYVYFNNDVAGYAPRNALRLKEMLGAWQRL